MAAIKVHLKNFRVQGYRSCKRTEFELEDRLTALIGPNGAGKTNIMHALRLLRGLGRRRPERPAEKDQYALRSHAFAKFEINRRILRLKMEITFRLGENGLEYPLGVKEFWNLTNFGVSEPWVSLQPVRIYRHSAEKRRIVLASPYGDDLAIVRSARRKPVGLVPLSAEARAAVQATNLFRRGIDYYSASQFTNPAVCPTSFEVDEDGDLIEQFSPVQNNHLRFVHDLYKMSIEDKTKYISYINLVGRNGIRLVDEINWKPTTFSSNSYEVRSGGKIINRKRERTLIIPVVTVSGQQLSLDQLSERTFRTLATLFHVMTDASSLLLLEEPEVCVHHGLLTSVIQVVKDYARRKQIIISTHSESVLDSFDPEQVRLVFRLEKSGTKVTSLSQSLSRRRFAALKLYLVNEGNLGEYWRHGGLEK